MYCFIVKPTTDCNLVCDYCYQRALDANSVEMMGVELAKKLITEAVAISKKRVDFIWHGGEPLLMGKDFFGGIFTFGERLTGQRDFTLHHVIQTNGTLLDEEWATLIAGNNVSVGVSLDGPPHVHNAQRCGKTGEGSFDAVLAGIRLLEEHNIPFGTLAVVSPTSLGASPEIYRFFVESGFNSLDFLACSNYSKDERAPWEISLRDFVEFLNEIFLLWIEQDDPNIHIRRLENVITGLLGGVPSLCRFNGSCSDFLTVLSNGDIYPCDTLIGVEKFRLGNLKNGTLDQMFKGEGRKRFLALIAEQRKTCETCGIGTVCNGGCTAERFFFGDETFCSARRFLVGKVRKGVAHLL